jgi:hypothetical protein
MWVLFVAALGGVEVVGLGCLDQCCKDKECLLAPVTTSQAV